jgi:hypothetical protein
MKNLDPKILSILSKKLIKQKSTIRQQISILRRDFPGCTLNAVAQIYARKHDISVIQKLDEEDKGTLPNMEVRPAQVVVKKTKTQRKPLGPTLITYETSDHFVRGHIDELNRAYSTDCYTSANIMARKVVENLVIDILRRKYPPTSRENKELYYDIAQHRFKDFSVILDNLYAKRTEFGLDEKKVVERLVTLLKNFKEDANDKTHSWYYLVRRRSEIDDLDIPSIIALIVKLEQSVGLRPV